jgi:hypothetical protein
MLRFFEADVRVVVEQIAIRGTLNATSESRSFTTVLWSAIDDGKMHRLDEYGDPSGSHATGWLGSG